MKNVRFIGWDVHAETIAVAVAESGPNVPEDGSAATRRFSGSAAMPTVATRKLGEFGEA